MPKIPQDVQKGIESGEINTEGGGTVEIDGYVLAQFVEVDETPKKESGFASTHIVYEVVAGEHDGSKLHDWISHNPSAGWRFAQILEATEYTPDTDLDELVEEGEQVVLLCRPEIQSKGKRAGSIRTVIDQILPPTAENLDLAGVVYEEEGADS